MYIGKIKTFFKNNIMAIIAFFVALVSVLIIPPDREYLNYIDYKTIISLFLTLAVVSAFKRINFFYILAQKIVSVFSNIRSCILILVVITFIGSMFLANDMALLTFLPLGYYVLYTSKKEKYMAFTFIMQNIAANLGGCLTPFGNPQNLYLYSYFNIPTFEFLKIMFPTFLLSITLIFCCCCFIKKDKVKLQVEKTVRLSEKKAIIYSFLFILCILMIFNIIPHLICLFIISIVLFIVDKKVFKEIDYSLLFTFVFFFIFAGNISRVSQIENILSLLLQKNTLLFSALSCQFISNVPSAILLSHFTDNFPALLVGVNIGGTGTLISSLASLITFKEYIKHNKNGSIKYIALFSLFNFSFLIILFILNYIILN